MSEGNELQQLEARIAKARADREATEAQADAKRKLELLRLEAEAEERAAVEAEVFAKLEAEHGPIGKRLKVVPTDAGAIVVKRPPLVTFRKFQDQHDKPGALERLVYPCLLHPSKVDFDRLCEEIPAALMLAANAVTELAGVGNRDLSGK